MFTKRIAALAACLAVSAPVWASSQVSASISNFKVSVDAGSFNWVLSGGSTQLGVGSSDYTQYTPSSSAYYISAAWMNSGSAGTPMATLAVDTANTVLPVVSYAGASSSATGLSASVSTPNSGGDAGATAQWLGSFVLGQHSKVTFTWEEQLAGVNTGGDILPNSQHSNGLASSEVKIGSNLRSFASQEALSDYDTVAGLDEGYAFGSGGTVLHRLTVSNLQGTTNATFAFSAMVRANTYDYVGAPVPEPETYALALSGLVITLVLKGRKRT